jgi:hypothetical protein
MAEFALRLHFAIFRSPELRALLLMGEFLIFLILHIQAFTIIVLVVLW